MIGRPSGMRARSLVSTAIMTLGLAIGVLSAPPATVACSCAMNERPMQAAATEPSISVFTGFAGPLGPTGVPVQLTRWFHGPPPPSGVAVLDPAGFEDPMGGMCGTNAPDVGAEWIFAAWRNDVGRYDVSLCTTHAALATDWGRDLMAEAVTVFGSPVVPEAPAGPAEPAAADPGAASLLDTILPMSLAGLVAVAVVVGLSGLAARRRGDG